MWSTYITETIQSGNATQYCVNKNIPYRTQQKLAGYNKNEDKEIWSPDNKSRYSHCVFTDSTEKAAVELFDIKYVETNKFRDGNDLAALLMLKHKQKDPASVVINVSYSTSITNSTCINNQLARIAGHLTINVDTVIVYLRTVQRKQQLNSLITWL